MSRNFLVIDPEDGLHVLKSLASSARVAILKLLHQGAALNIPPICSPRHTAAAAR